MNRFALTNVSTPGAAIAALHLEPATGALDYARLNQKRPLGGGSDLLGEIKEGLYSPSEIVNLKTIAAWNGIRTGEDGALEVGATTPIVDVMESGVVRGHCAALADAAEHVGSPQIRNQGTVGGNLCQRPRCWYYRNVDTVCLKKGGKVCFAVEGENKYHAIFGQEAPCRMVSTSNLGVALLALDGKVRVHSAAGEKLVPAAEFFRMPTADDPYRETSLQPGEIVGGITVAKQEGRRSAYMQFSERADFDWALVSAAVSLSLDGSGVISEIRLAMNAVAPVPWRLTKAEDFLRGKKPDEANVREAARLALADAQPLKHNGYKVPIAKALLVRVVKQAVEAKA
jgi:xanthine dehydrogenase YagS FAD-binding subunit